MTPSLDESFALLNEIPFTDAYVEVQRDFGGQWNATICVPLASDDPRRDGWIGNIEYKTSILHSSPQAALLDAMNLVLVGEAVLTP